MINLIDSDFNCVQNNDHFYLPVLSPDISLNLTLCSELMPELVSCAPCGHAGGEVMTGDWTGDSEPTRAATELGVFSVGKLGCALQHCHTPALSTVGPSPVSTLQCLGQISMEMPQRAGLPRLICRAEEAAWLVSLPPPLVRAKTRAGRGRHNYHSQTRRGMRRLLINRHLRAMTGSSENILVGLQPNIPTLLLLLLLLRWF